MSVVQMLACDGCGVFSSQSPVQKVTITVTGKRVTVDACRSCMEPINRLIDSHSTAKKTGRTSGLSSSNVLVDPSNIIKDNPRPRKRIVKRA